MSDSLDRNCRHTEALDEFLGEKTMGERDKRLEELTRQTGTAADKATKAATTAAQAADKADEALNWVTQ
ncbi:hypothetical protein HBR93_26365 [Pseudomonas sp. WS 5411]|uniref:hypothetical protein n=1 Tax=Pseudomonas sp. WS 5411 TaxID=2717486 RepID=UPI0014726CF8|nr:hypothetical protein [Pseudomonas sp. WS 5411]NMY87627.1 hypothetical protein [Pseudomonas sp. WS 5411]